MSITTGSTPAVTTPPPMMGKEAIFSKLSSSSATTGSAPSVSLPLMPILIMDGKDPSGGLSSNTILAGLIANPSLEPPDDIDDDDDICPDGNESISTVLDSLSLNPDTDTPNPDTITPETYTPDTDIESQSKQQNQNNNVTVTGPSIKDCISLTTILGEVQGLANNVAGLEAAQTISSIEEGNNMVAAATISSNDTVTAAERDFQAAVVSLIATSVSCLVSVAMVGASSRLKGNETQVQGKPPEAHPVMHTEDGGGEEGVSTSKKSEPLSKSTTHSPETTSNSSNHQTSAKPSKATGHTKGTNKDSNANSTNKSANPNEAINIKGAEDDPDPKVKIDHNKMSKDVKMQTVNGLAQSIGQMITSAGDLWSAHVKIGAAYYQGEAQENSTLSSYYGNAQQMCNTNIAGIAQLVTSLEGSANEIAQAMESMVSSTKA